MFENLEIPQDIRPLDPRFGVGPSLIPNTHLQNLAKSGDQLLGTGHRKPAVRTLCSEIQDGLKNYYKLPHGYEVIMGNGGATFLFDMIGLGLVKKKSYHYVCGEFSKKWYESHKIIPWIEADCHDSVYGECTNAEDQKDADMICCTQSETSTGVMFSSLPKVGEDTLLAVDATSSAGQFKIDFSKVDLYFFSPQKIMASEGGLYIAILSPKALKRAKELYEVDHYRPQVMSWKFAIENSLNNQTYNTPSISGLFLMNEQIKLLNSLGLDAVEAQAREKYQVIKDWVESKNYLEFFVKNETYRSLSVATVNVDEKYCMEVLGEKLREQRIAYDIEGYRKLGKNQLRISLFHNININDLIKLTKVISYAIEKEF